MVMRVILAIVFLYACQELPVLTTKQQAADVRVPELFDPYKLPNILGKDGAYVEPRFEGATNEVPKVDIKLPTGNGIVYYEIQRCPVGVELKTLAGTYPLESDYESEAQKIKDYLYVWGKAAAGACTLLGGIRMATPFVDRFGTEKFGGTDSFSFFYLVRPCLNHKNSIYGARRMCHYAFARTETIRNYVNPMVIENMKLRTELVHKRARIETRMMQIASKVREKANYLRECEIREAKKLAFKRRLAGIAKVYLTVAATATAAVLSGGTAAFLAGSAAIQLGDKLFSGISNATLNCPTGNYDRQITAWTKDAEETVARIGEIREVIDGLKLEGAEEIPDNEIAATLGLEGTCASAEMGNTCLSQ